MRAVCKCGIISVLLEDKRCSYIFIYCMYVCVCKSMHLKICVCVHMCVCVCMQMCNACTAVTHVLT